MSRYLRKALLKDKLGPSAYNAKVLKNDAPTRTNDQATVREHATDNPIKHTKRSHPFESTYAGKGLEAAQKKKRKRTRVPEHPVAARFAGVANTYIEVVVELASSKLDEARGKLTAFANLDCDVDQDGQQILLSSHIADINKRVQTLTRPVSRHRVQLQLKNPDGEDETRVTTTMADVMADLDKERHAKAIELKQKHAELEEIDQRLKELFQELSVRLSPASDDENEYQLSAGSKKVIDGLRQDIDDHGTNAQKITKAQQAEDLKAMQQMMEAVQKAWSGFSSKGA